MRARSCNATMMSESTIRGVCMRFSLARMFMMRLFFCYKAFAICIITGDSIHDQERKSQNEWHR